VVIYLKNVDHFGGNKGRKGRQNEILCRSLLSAGCNPQGRYPHGPTGSPPAEQARGLRTTAQNPGSCSCNIPPPSFVLSPLLPLPSYTCLRPLQLAFSLPPVSCPPLPSSPRAFPGTRLLRWERWEQGMAGHLGGTRNQQSSTSNTAASGSGYCPGVDRTGEGDYSSR